MNRVIEWTDGTWAVLKAKDVVYPCPRSKTNDTVQDAIKSASWSPTLNLPPGRNSGEKYVKVRVADLPAEWFNAKPAVPAKAKPIADYPHRCHVCGGNMLILFSSVEHEGGACPGEGRKAKHGR